MRPLALAVLVLPALPLAAQTPPRPPAERAEGPVVEAEMRHVIMHVSDSIALRIRYLRGRLVPRRADTPPSFDDKASFTIDIDTAEVGMDTASLGGLLNTWVFAYPGAPLKHLHVRIEGGEIVQSGTMHKGVDVPFTMRAAPAVLPDGALRLHPTKMKAAGIKVLGLMKFLSLEMDKLIKLKRSPGVRLVNNDFLLYPAQMLPPPYTRGRLVAARLEGGELVQVFRREGPRRDAPKLRPIDPGAANYLLYKGGVVHFGRLTMAPTDMQLVDADPRDWLDFDLDRYNLQLMAGSTRTRPDFALLAVVPDIHALRRGPSSPTPAPSPPTRARPRAERSPTASSGGHDATPPGGADTRVAACSRSRTPRGSTGCRAPTSSAH
jgi:hypothetical protein